MTERRLSPARLGAFAVLVPALMLGALEGGLRLLEDDDAAFAVDAATSIAYQRLPDDLLVEHDQHWAFADLLIDANDLRIPRREGERRVLLVGGSQAGGWNLPWTQNMAGVADRLLGEAGGENVRVYNLARSGWGSAQVYQLVDRVIDVLQPELVVLVSGNNEHSDVAAAASMLGGDVDRVLRARSLRARLAIARALPQLRGPDVGTFGPEEKVPAPMRDELVGAEAIEEYALSRYERNVARIVRRVRASGAGIVVGTVGVNDRFERWVHPLGMLRDQVRGASWVDAYLRARWLGPPESGLEALAASDAAEGGFGDGDFERVLLQADLLRAAGRSENAARLLAEWPGRQAAAEGLDPAGRLRDAWWAGLEDPAGAPSAVKASLAARPLGSPGGDDCYAAQALYLAGAIEEARAEFEACRLHAYLYRAHPHLNARLGALADRMGVPVLDIDGAVRAEAEHGITGPAEFWDYCHYTPGASIVAGHVVAAGIAKALGLEVEIPSPAAGKAAFDVRWRARSQDPVELEHWVGVDLEGVGAVRTLEGRVLSPLGQTAVEGMYRGNRIAALLTPGRARSYEEADRSWRFALELDPSLADVVDGNRAWARWLMHEGPAPAMRSTLWEPPSSP